MIERKFVAEKIKEFQIQEYMNKVLRGVGQSHIKLQRTPLGEKIVIFASKPGLIVGRSGENIKKLTKSLKKKFGLENPQIEISEIENIYLDANIVAEKIAMSLERFGLSKFKGIGHKSMELVMGAGALGIEILISGKIPSSRAKSWRFYQGYIKKCGDVALTKIRKSYKTANLKIGTVGIQVRIMPPDVELPDKIIFKTDAQQSQETEKRDKETQEKKEEEKSTEERKKEEKAKRKNRKKKEVIAEEKTEEKKTEAQ